MEDLLYISSLYDYYSCLLTEKERIYFEDYYFNNLTMDEIAQNYNVTKNAISKTLIDVKDKIQEYESKLHLESNRLKIKELLDEDEYKKIENYI